LRAAGGDCYEIGVMDRVQALKNFISAKPNDPFPRYGLAMELKNAGELGEASAAFAELVEKFPDYVATYLMYGSVLSELQERDRARAIYSQGIEVAARAGDGHAQSELQAALAQLG